jgi:hypothetical protein
MFTKIIDKTGHLFERMFDLWRSIYASVSPNKIFIFILFCGVAVWLYVQHKYNQEAEKNGTYK